MDLQLKGKKALVTGSTAGIGYAIAFALAREGANVVINGRTKERVESSREKIAEMAGEGVITGVAADLSGDQGVSGLIEEIPDVDILVNNLGIFEPKPFENITDSEWFTFFEVNVMSGVRLSRHYLPKMKEKNWGRIVFISSESGIHIPEEMIHYGVTKAAMLGVSRGLAEITEKTNVTVNAVLPGPTLSEGVAGFVEQLAGEQGKSMEQMKKEFFQTARPTSIIKRFLETDEIANMVAYVCSPLASGTNGAALRVDGGVVKTIV